MTQSLIETLRQAHDLIQRGDTVRWRERYKVLDSLNAAIAEAAGEAPLLSSEFFATAKLTQPGENLVDAAATVAEKAEPRSAPLPAASPAPAEDTLQQIASAIGLPADDPALLMSAIKTAMQVAHTTVASPAPAVPLAGHTEAECSAAEFDHDIGADRFKVAKGPFWWHIRIGDSTGNVGKFHSKMAAEDVALKMLTAFRDGAYMQYQAMRPTAQAAPAPQAEPVATQALRTIIRMADQAKEPCPSDPESPAAIRNGRFASIAQVAAQGLGWVRGPDLGSSAPAAQAASPAPAVPAEPVATAWMLNGEMVNAFPHPPLKHRPDAEYWAAKGYSEAPLYATPQEAPATEPPTIACHWRQDDEGSGTYWTDCRHGFSFTDGGPADNGMNHCCYCGKTLAEEQWAPPPSDDDEGDGITAPTAPTGGEG